MNFLFVGTFNASFDKLTCDKQKAIKTTGKTAR